MRHHVVRYGFIDISKEYAASILKAIFYSEDDHSVLTENNDYHVPECIATHSRRQYLSSIITLPNHYSDEQLRITVYINRTYTFLLLRTLVNYLTLPTQNLYIDFFPFQNKCLKIIIKISVQIYSVPSFNKE